MYKLVSIGDKLTIGAEDGSAGEVTVADIQFGVGDDTSIRGQAVITVEDQNGDIYRYIGSSFIDDILEEGMVEESKKPVVAEAVRQPAGTFWVNQLVSVREASTNKKVDTGLVTKVDHKAIHIGEEVYEFAKYDILALG